MASDQTTTQQPSHVAHTPGPWYVGELCSNRIKVESHQDGFVAEVWRYGKDGDANAHLIAAAPELYELLKAAGSALARISHPDTRWDDPLMRRIRAAIAKAEGREE